MVFALRVEFVSTGDATLRTGQLSKSAATASFVEAIAGTEEAEKRVLAAKPGLSLGLLHFQECALISSLERKMLHEVVSSHVQS